MIYITLLCAAGMSTNLLLRKMKIYAQEQNLEINIIAMSMDSLKEFSLTSDVLLLAPQVSYRLGEVQSIYENHDRIAIIDMATYGMLDGKKAILTALKLLEK